MKQRVVFLFYHGLGHIIAFSKVARILENADYEVYFAGVGFFHPYIIAQGFKSYPLGSNPFGMGLETWINTIEKRKYVYWSALRDRVKDRVYHDREVELYWMLEELKPSIVLIDALQATDFIVLYPHLKNGNIKTAIVHTTLPLHLTPGLPPLNSDALPTDKHEVQNARHSFRVAQWKKKFIKKIIHWGFDDHFLIKRRIIKNSVLKHYVSEIPGLVNFSTKNLPEFIIAPKEFDFPNANAESSRHYIGFMTNENRHEKIESGYEKISSTITELKKDKNLKLVYCSFGTIEPKEKNVFFSFLQKVIKVLADEKHICVISLKAKKEDLALLPTSEHIHLFNFVPQLEVLKQADLFITHGGLNSIKEAVYAEVPMLMYPIHPEYDPNGNTARIFYHGMGLRGKVASDTEDNIREKVRELLSNPVYRRNIQKMKRLDSKYTSENFLNVFTAIQHLTV